MGYRYDDLAVGEIYHVFSRGVEKRDIFMDDKDRTRFEDLLLHCLPQGRVISFSMAQRFKQQQVLTESGEGIVDLLAYCLMSNHFHLLLRENVAGGTSLYMKRLLTSYSMYFNSKNDRSGSLFVHPFKAVLVEKDEQFLHVSRYIHLNPVVARMVKYPNEYRWSSINSYMSRANVKVHTDLLISMMSKSDYLDFMKSKLEKSMPHNSERLFIDMED